VEPKKFFLLWGREARFNKNIKDLNTNDSKFHSFKIDIELKKIVHIMLQNKIKNKSNNFLLQRHLQ
jgi:hypothetical protein